MTHPYFLGWRVVAGAFVVAVFGWGVSFYGPPVFLHALHAERGWTIGLVSAAISAHFLVGAVWVANLARLHRRWGVGAITRAAALATALGFLGWALAPQPWMLFAAAPLTGFGWAGTGGAAINAMVAPWFVRRRPAALSTAYNGASLGGILFSPLWVVLIAQLGLTGALAAVGAAMVLVLWALSVGVLGRSPDSLGQQPDGPGEAPAGPARPQGQASLSLRGRPFLTLAGAASLSLFAQIGLIAHLYSLLAAVLGAGWAGLAAGLATGCAILGRTAMGWLLHPGADRRQAAAGNAAFQALGSVVFLLAGPSPELMLLGAVLFGLGVGNATSLPPLIAQQDFRPAETARAVALVTAASQASYAFAPAAFGLVREWAPGGALFLLAGGAQLLAAAVFLAGRQRPACTRSGAGA
jgi:MFS family permease